MVSSLFSLFLLLGSEWVLYVLLGCSLLGTAVFFNRFKVLSSQERVGRILWNKVLKGWQDTQAPKDWFTQAENLVREYPCAETRMLKNLAIKKNNEGLNDLNKMKLNAQSYLASERIHLDSYLPILGTLGNAAPFIGLFGTVLGIIRAFATLDKVAGSSGFTGISGGLAEALVTTAAGLLVAIPSAIAYNYFQRKIKIILTRTQCLSEIIMSEK